MILNYQVFLKNSFIHKYIYTFIHTTGISEIVKDSVLIKCSVFVVTASTIAQVFGADATFYLYLFEDNAGTAKILDTGNRVLLFVTALVWAFAKFRWLRLIMIRYNTCFITFGQLSFSEKRYLLVQVPTILFGIMRVFWYFFYSSEVQNGYWLSQTESSLIVDVSAQYLFLAIASSKRLQLYSLLSNRGSILLTVFK